MAVENETPPAGTSEAHGDDTGDDDLPDPRHRADQERRRKLQADNAELLTWKNEREAADRKTADERDRKAGDHEKVISSRDTKIRDLEEKLDAAEATIEGTAKATRRDRFLDGILAGSGVTNRALAALVLPTLGLDDDAPENFTERDARDARKALHKKAPELFGGGSTDPKPPPGGGKSQSGKTDWNKVGSDYTDRSTNSAYSQAKGQGRPQQ